MKEVLKDQKSLYISFSARSKGNCESVARFLMEKNDQFIAFKDLFYHNCSDCSYECFKDKCKYRNDDIYNLIDSFENYEKIIFLVPMYCGNPSSLYFVLSERMQDYFNHNEEKYTSFLKKLYIVGILGSSKETPYFLPLLSSWFSKEEAMVRVLGIERHKYQQKMNECILDNQEIKQTLTEFSKNLNGFI